MKILNSRRWTSQQIASAVIVVGSTLMLLTTLHPELILRNNTPTGGDMGAHVYGPAFLRDFLLPHFRLTGWSNDWYSGFPMYRFYMVVPALAVLLLDLLLPYGIALKLIAVLGILTMPVCTWLFGRFAKFMFPIPELMTLAAVVFLYDESFTIYGGNIASTMAGEFSFSISLTLAMLCFGLLIRVFEERRGHMLTALVLALSALCHGIVLLFVFGGVVLFAAVWFDRRCSVAALKVGVTGALLSAFWVLPFLTSHAYMTDMKYEPRPSGASDSFWSMYFPLTTYWDVFITLFATVGFVVSLQRKNRTGIWMGAYCVVLAFGVYVGRESLPVIGLLWNPRLLPFLYLLRYFLMMIGIYEAAVWAGKFYQLQRVGRQALAEKSVDDLQPVVSFEDNEKFNLSWITVMTVLVVSVIGFRFQEMPFGKITTNAAGENIYRWGFVSTKATNDGFVDGWARWNFTGYEGKTSYAEYRDLVETMKNIGRDPNFGCGRALWENNGELNKYGTTMSLMLLPHWTKGCIGSMEGLNFEASGTTPYHFIAAAAMSKQSSNPVRELRYDDNQAGLGVRYLQELGVRYYMAFTAEAIAQANLQAALVRIAESGPWVVYQVKDSDLVVPLQRQPVVVKSGSTDAKERWLEIGTSWFQHPEDWSAVPAESGPNSWQSVEVAVDLNRRQGEPSDPSRRVDIVTPTKTIDVVDLPVVNVGAVVLEDEAISFEVDKVGVPVLVRMSYFPNWKVEGAQGPYRVAPNMMVVVPTKNEVRLHYGYTAIDFFAYLLSVFGVAVMAVRWRGRQVALRRKSRIN
ncbi:MAG: 6-pyruvoyl-tetrahydropterin synthase-related protein [Actinomycetota bacterium]